MAIRSRDFDVDNGAVVRFYGCVVTTMALLVSCSNDDDIKLDRSEVDEDASNGESDGNTAPWLAVNASVPPVKKS